MPLKRSKNKPLHCNHDLEESNNFQNKKRDDSGSPINLENLAYRLKGETEQHTMEELGGRMECPLCKITVKNIHIHL